MFDETSIGGPAVRRYKQRRERRREGRMAAAGLCKKQRGGELVAATRFGGIEKGGHRREKGRSREIWSAKKKRESDSVWSARDHASIWFNNRPVR